MKISAARKTKEIQIAGFLQKGGGVTVCKEQVIFIVLLYQKRFSTLMLISIGYSGTKFPDIPEDSGILIIEISQDKNSHDILENTRNFHQEIVHTYNIFLIKTHRHSY